MSNNNLNIVPAKVTAVENLSNDVYVSTSHDGVSIKVVHVNKSGSNTVDFPAKNLIKDGSSNEIQWEVQCLQNSVLSTTNSGIKYTMQFGINMTAATIGRYYAKNGFIYYQKATVKSDGSSYTLAPPVAKCTTAMNSAFPFAESVVNYNGELRTTELFRKTAFYQMFLPKDYQETMSQTWFEGDTLLFDEYVLPYDEAGKKFVDISTLATWTGAMKNQQIEGSGASALKWLFRKDFFVPLNMLNQVFNYSNNFYTNAIKRQSLYITIKTQSKHLAKCFGSSEVFDLEYTGIGAIDLSVVTKSSQTVQTNMKEKGSHVLVQNNIGMESRPIVTMTTGQVLVNETSSRHASIARSALCLERKDADDADSTYLHQRFTGMTSKSMVDYRNNQLLVEQQVGTAGITVELTARNFSQDFVFFGNFNIQRGGDDQRLFSSDVQDLQSIRNEIIRSTNMHQQYDRGLAPAFSNMFEWLSKYAYVYSSLEQFSMDECSNDVIGDGYNSIQNSLMYKYNLVEYRNGRKANNDSTIVNTDLSVDTPLRAQNAGAKDVRIIAYTFYDTLLEYDLNNGQISIKDFQ
ncbi:Conserved_hypothetical protein [Hexamita inflata]|uniref:Uncharacterized protein n=1 Tax=Hexamita inflata TaxID=28002 RepID=A0AA86RPJ1_9EUKA|nr:Conserved hypothetical protein [Hexamita inflata]